jgi:hypothetical protein
MSEQMFFTSLLDPAASEQQTDPLPDPAAPVQNDPYAVQYYPIDEGLARRAKEMISFSNYVPGSATAEYRGLVDDAAALAQKQKEHVSPFYHDKIDHLLDAYARKLAQWTNDYNRNASSCPSVLIAGPANFPSRKKERQNAREHSLWSEYDTIKGILGKIKSTGTGPVDLSDPNARELLDDQLARLQDELNRDKELNKYYRKHKTLVGFPDLQDAAAQKMDHDFADTQKRCPWITQPVPAYELTSLGGKIKRVKDRIAELDRRQAQKEDPIPDQDFPGGRIVRNLDLDRLQILFDDIPDSATRDQLKSLGFRWSPKNKAWQRQLTTNAEASLDRFLALTMI